MGGIQGRHCPPRFSWLSPNPPLPFSSVLFSPLQPPLQSSVRNLCCFPFLHFFRGKKRILSDAGYAGFARLTPWPTSWYDRGMTVNFISIFRGFHLKPPNESHTPDSADSLIFLRKAKRERRRDKCS
jgi:hypothetical protein